MYAGQVVERGATSTLLRDPSHDYTRALLTSIPRLGDSRRRLPTVASIAPWLRDSRNLAPEDRPVTEMLQVSANQWVRGEGQEVAA
jgi:ABC-type dipeptide/oligopeptide/nickel transport system ATPase component